MHFLLSSANSNVVAAALATVGSMLEHYAVYGRPLRRVPEPPLHARRKRLAGLLLKGLASYRERAAGGAADPGRAALRLPAPSPTRGRRPSSP